MRSVILVSLLSLGLAAPATAQPLWDLAVVERHGLATAVSLAPLPAPPLPTLPAPILATLGFLLTWADAPGTLAVPVRVPGAEGTPQTFRLVVPVRGLSLLSETADTAIVLLADLQMQSPLGALRGPASVVLMKTRPTEWTVTAVTVR